MRIPGARELVVTAITAPVTAAARLPRELRKVNRRLKKVDAHLRDS